MKFLLAFALFLFLPLSFASASELVCSENQHIESVLITPAVEGTPAVTHTVVVTDAEAYDEVVVDSPAHYNYFYEGSNDGDYDVVANVHHTGHYNHTTGHTYVYVSSATGGFDFVSATHHGDYSRVSVPAVTHTVHHDAVTHEEVVIDTPAVESSPAVYEEECVDNPSEGGGSEEPVVTPTEEHRSSGGVFVCDIAHGNKHWVMEKDEKGVEYRACRPITQTFGSTYPSTCAMLTALSTNGANYCVNPTPLYEQSWFRNAVIWLYSHR